MKKSLCNIIEFGQIKTVKGQKICKRNDYDNVFNIHKARKKYNNTGLFVSAYRYSSTDINDSFLFGDMYFDFDYDKENGKTFNHVRQDVLQAIDFMMTGFGLPIGAFYIYFSGKKGIHLLIHNKYFDIKPSKNLNIVFKNIAVSVNKITPNKTVDLVVYDKRRIFRLVNSIHQDTGLYKIPITYEELKTLKLSDIKQLAKSKRHLKRELPVVNIQAKQMFEKYIHKTPNKITAKNSYTRKLNYTPPCIAELLNNEAPAGNRNNILAILASHFKNRQYPIDKTIDILDEWSSCYCNPRIRSDELDKTIKSIYNSCKSYGCYSIKNITDCSSNCRFNKSK